MICFKMESSLNWTSEVVYFHWMSLKADYKTMSFGYVFSQCLRQSAEYDEFASENLAQNKMQLLYLISVSSLRLMNRVLQLKEQTPAKARFVMWAQSLVQSEYLLVSKGTCSSIEMNCTRQNKKRHTIAVILIIFCWFFF